MNSDYTKRLNPCQMEAVQHINGPLLIVAGAGSGKTRGITRRIAYLIARRGVQRGLPREFWEGYLEK